ncbi:MULTISPECIES: BMC domain-containing protein [unclassified Agarivorans]|uniref:BMC domain-containing protein n=1 Tax=unclassified Agarivorans TaxID=2636026 RepID=UPI003D7C5B28
MKVSLGLLEVKGLALAINTADAMAKSAAIRIADVESSKGSGWTLIKITGDVAAVQAAISTGAALAEKCGGLVSKKVLSRPDVKLLAMTLPTPAKPKAAPAANKVKASRVTKAASPTAAIIDQPEPTVEPTAVVTELPEQHAEPVTASTELPEQTTEPVTASTEPLEPTAEPAATNTEQPEQAPELAATELDTEQNQQAESAQVASCNLCHDIACPRKKGEPRRDCINGGKVK